MFDEHTKIEKIYGKVYVNDKEIGKSYYEFTYNSYKANEMKITLVNPPFSITKIFNKNVVKLHIKTEFFRSSYTLVLNYELISYRMTGTGLIINYPVREFKFEQTFEKENSESFILFGFYFPLTALTDNKYGRINHSDFGLIRGEHDFDTEEIKLRKEEYNIETSLGEFKINDLYEFLDLPSNELYTQVNVLKRSICSIKIPFVVEKYQNDIYNILAFVEIIFSIISFLERDRINWTSMFLRIQNQNESYDKTIETYRWHEPVSKNYYKNRTDFNRRKDTFKSIIQAFELLADDEKERIIKLINNMKIANCSKTIETQLIYFHSCLDFLRKEYHKKKSSFSKDLIDFLDENNVCINDLVEEEALADIRKKTNNKSIFNFTKLRNEYIHEGFDSFNGKHEKVLKEIYIMRSILERFILKRLGIDFTETVLGKY